MSAMEIDVRPGTRVGVGMLIPQVQRHGAALKIDLYGGEMFEADLAGEVTSYADFHGTLTIYFSNEETAIAAEEMADVLRNENLPVIVRFDDTGCYTSITQPDTGMRIAGGSIR